MRTHLYILMGLSVVAASAQDRAATNAPPAEKFVFAPLAASEATVAPGTNVAPADAAVVSSGYVIDDKHKLIPGDKISFQILEDRLLKGPKGEPKGDPRSLMVTDSSELDIPYIGRVSVADKTCKQLCEELKALLEREYYYRASVIIGLDQVSKVLGKVYVLGPVRTQGPIDIPANETFTAGKAILRAGGFGDFADKKEVKVIRKTPTGNITYKLNMVEILEKGKTEGDMTLEPEDFVIVPQRAITF